MHVVQGQGDHGGGDALSGDLNLPTVGAAVAGDDLQLIGNLPLFRCLLQPLRHPVGHIGADADGRAAAQVEAVIGADVWSLAEGHVHCNCQIRLNVVNSGDRTGAVGLLTAGTKDVHIHIQLRFLEQFQGLQQDDEATPVVHGSTGHPVVPQGVTTLSEHHRRTNRNLLHRLLLR